MVLLRAALKRFFAYWGGFSAIGLAGWIGRTFGEPSIDQILFHLHYSEGVALRMGRLFVVTFVAEVLLIPLAFAIAAAFLHQAVARARPSWQRHFLRAAPAAAIIVGFVFLLDQFSVFSLAAARLRADRFAKAFVDPDHVRLEDRQLRNLVLIYVESMEDGYGDAGLFENDLLAPLRQLGGVSFESYRPAAGTTWTMAAMVATQCGVPLSVYSEYDIRRTQRPRDFLAGATCLGDLLEARGYRNVFLGGAPLSFAGKGVFLKDHGYAETFGREEWEKLGAKSQEFGPWGLYDSALLERARSKLDALHASGKHFNLTLLTLDTHNPSGFMSPHCRDQGAKDFEGIVGCTNREVADFVKHVQDKGYLKDTVIVILGDHLAVPNPAYDKLQARERRIFNLFVAQPQPRLNRQEVVPFDMFPTLSDLVGMRVPGSRLGLGSSGVSDATEPGSAASDYRPDLTSLRGSKAYGNLWRLKDH